MTIYPYHNDLTGKSSEKEEHVNSKQTVTLSYLETALNQCANSPHYNPYFL